jgi:hypothetical protein
MVHHCLSLMSLGIRVVEDEEHFLCHCPLYSKLRNELISNDKLDLNNELSSKHLLFYLLTAERKVILLPCIQRQKIILL